MKIFINRYVVIILSLILTLPFLIKLGKVKVEDNVDYFHDKQNPDIKFYDSFKKLFENDEFFIIAFKKKDIFTSKNLKTIKLITKDLESLKEVREVKSLSNIDHTLGENEFFIVKKFLETIPEDKDELKNLKDEALSNPLFEKNFISKDGKTGAIIVYVYENTGDSEYRKKTINKCRSKLAEYKAETGEVFIGGWTITNYYLSHLMQKDLKNFIPVTYLFITIAIFLIFRNLWLVFLSFSSISLCMICTMGVFYYLGISINNVTTIIPPLVMALALCDTVHIFSYLGNYSFETKSEKRANIIVILKKLFLPCFLTSFTTAIGFASLYVSEIPPIKDFAKAATIGMVFEFVFAFTFLPSMLLLVPFEKAVERKSILNLDKLLGLISKTVRSHFMLINFIGFSVIAGSVYFTLDISTETNVIEYFKKNSDIQKSNQFIKENLAGLSTFDISIQGKKEDAFKEPEALKVIEKIQTYMDKIKGVDKTLSFVDFLKDMNKSFHNENDDFLIIPESREMVSQYLLIYDSDDIKEYINNDFDHARISVRISEDSTKEQKIIIQKINAYIEQSGFDGFSVRITGRVFNDVIMIDSLVRSQIWSLFIAGFIIISIMFVIMKSFKLGFLSIIPNLLPIIINFGIMGFFGIPLNAATALIAAVALGIAVDDTIHFLTTYSKYSKVSATASQAVDLTIMDKGKAIITSSFILTIGFGTLVLSSFVPSIYFGLLCSIIMVTAVIGDLLFLPSLILFTYKIKNREIADEVL
ncbi:MAG: MMPL family transporter [Desulforegulaceae bacterium]|nr:MMPL family transporter [Desulforegulaceae bacterium]